eukprot:GHVR01078233.1.p1 GENE.GHVR01078233.1~~GHVR01078233.1.p1  ORF type:complete len:204 (+),score=29.55 GHVR01078233.1:717-1328(+)
MLRETEGKLKQTKDKLKLSEEARVSAEREIKEFFHKRGDVLAGKGERNLILACTHGRLGEVKMLLELGVDVNCTNNQKDGRTPLMWASQEGHINVMEWLHRKCAALDIEDTDGDTPVAHATIAGHLDAVKWLHDKGASLKHRNKVWRVNLSNLINVINNIRIILYVFFEYFITLHYFCKPNVFRFPDVYLLTLFTRHTLCVIL